MTTRNYSQRGGFVEPRISTATTLGGATEGIGFDGRGLGDGGVSLISAHKCNDQGDHQRENLDSQQDDRMADARCRVLENGLVVLVPVVEIARGRSLHLAKIGPTRLGGLKQLTPKKTNMDAARKQRDAALAHAQDICHGSSAERDRNIRRTVTNRKSSYGYDD
jgi:hypothetical protein